MRNNLTQKRGLGAVTTTASPWLCHIPDTFPRTPSKWVSSPHLAGKNKSETRWASSCLYSHRNQEKQQGNDCLCAHENLELLHRTKQNSFTIWGSISRWEGLVAIISPSQMKRIGLGTNNTGWLRSTWLRARPMAWKASCNAMSKTVLGVSMKRSWSVSHCSNALPG